MKIGSYIQMERMGSSKSYTVDIIVDESKLILSFVIVQSLYKLIIKLYLIKLKNKGIVNV